MVPSPRWPPPEAEGVEATGSEIAVIFRGTRRGRNCNFRRGTRPTGGTDGQGGLGRSPGRTFPDDMFADLISSDRATRALRDRISWTVATGLALSREGIDYSRADLLAEPPAGLGAAERIFVTFRAVIDARRACLAGGHGRRAQPCWTTRSRPRHRQSADRRDPPNATGRPRSRGGGRQPARHDAGAKPRHAHRHPERTSGVRGHLEQVVNSSS